MTEEIKIKPFIPLWNREGNYLIRMEDSFFDDGVGHTGILTTAIYWNKKKKKEDFMDAWIKWDKK